MRRRITLTEKISILLADDHPLFREGVVRTLQAARDFDVVGECGDANEAVELAIDLLPDLALLDISMPGSGIEAARRIALACPVVRIVMLTVSEQDDDVMAALDVGARGYILKGIGGKELTDILRTIQRGGSYVSPDLAARLLVDLGGRGDTQPKVETLAELTAREEQILRSVARGLSNKEVGDELNIREKTVKHYMTNILQKLQVRNRVEAALVASRHYRDSES
jgi:two-component system nitrate/nitrite response regulator NarL